MKHIIALLMAAAITVSAADNNKAAESAKAIKANYSKGEWSLAGFASYRVHEFDHLDGRLGGGAEVSYFLKDNIAIAFEGLSEDTGHSVVDEVGLNAKAFIPIKKTGFAPYLLLGATYVTEDDGELFSTTGSKKDDKKFKAAGTSSGSTTQETEVTAWRMNAGAGIEYRYKNLALFGDGRWTHDFDTIGQAVFRIGGGLSF